MRNVIEYLAKENAVSSFAKKEFETLTKSESICAMGILTSIAMENCGGSKAFAKEYEIELEKQQLDMTEEEILSSIGELRKDVFKKIGISVAAFAAPVMIYFLFNLFGYDTEIPRYLLSAAATIVPIVVSGSVIRYFRCKSAKRKILKRGQTAPVTADTRPITEKLSYELDEETAKKILERCLELEKEPDELYDRHIDEDLNDKKMRKREFSELGTREVVELEKELNLQKQRWKLILKYFLFGFSILLFILFSFLFHAIISIFSVMAGTVCWRISGICAVVACACNSVWAFHRMVFKYGGCGCPVDYIDYEKISHKYSVQIFCYIVLLIMNVFFFCLTILYSVLTFSS